MDTRAFWPFLFFAAAYAQDQNNTTAPEKDSSLSASALTYRLVLSVLLVLLSGLFSGLTLGLMGLDKTGLEIVIGAGEADNATADERKQARAATSIQKVRENGNLLLTTLLLGNVAVNALISILLADMTSGTVGFVVSTAVIVVFGEIIPQALCSRYALLIGAKAVPLVQLIIFIIYPLAKPVSWCLDKALGEEMGSIHTKRELMKMLEIYVGRHALDREEGEIMHGVLSYKEKKVEDVMTPIPSMYTLPVTARLSYKQIREIFDSGYSRIPVWGSDVNDIVGLLFVKDLIFIDPEDETPLQNFIQIFGRGVHKVWPDTKLDACLRLFKMGKGHLALVHDVDNTGPGDPFYKVVGLVTLEDIIEEILQDEIVDETDNFSVDSSHSRTNSFDSRRLRLIDTRIVEETLGLDESKALAAHLYSNYPNLKEASHEGRPQLTVKDFMELVSGCPVETIEPSAEAEPLFCRGVAATECIVVIRGRVGIAAGREAFESEAGPWTVLGTEGLLVPPGTYVPDFTARIIGPSEFKCLRIPHEKFQKILSGEMQVSPMSEGHDEKPLAVAVEVVESSRDNTAEETRSIDTDLAASMGMHETSTLLDILIQDPKKD